MTVMLNTDDDENHVPWTAPEGGPGEMHMVSGPFSDDDDDDDDLI